MWSPPPAFDLSSINKSLESQILELSFPITLDKSLHSIPFHLSTRSKEDWVDGGRWRISAEYLVDGGYPRYIRWMADILISFFLHFSLFFFLLFSIFPLRWVSISNFLPLFFSSLLPFARGPGGLHLWLHSCLASFSFFCYDEDRSVDFKTFLKENIKLMCPIILARSAVTKLWLILLISIDCIK